MPLLVTSETYRRPGPFDGLVSRRTGARETGAVAPRSRQWLLRHRRQRRDGEAIRDDAGEITTFERRGGSIAPCQSQMIAWDGE
jgi:hypothetical protein